MAIIISTHAFDRMRERFPDYSLEVMNRLIKRAFTSPINSRTLKTGYGDFLRYYATKNGDCNTYVTRYNGILFVFNFEKGMLVTLFEDVNDASYNRYCRYKKINRG